MLGLSPVTLYSIASRLVSYYSSFVGSATGMTMPLFSQYDGEKNHDSLKSSFLFLSKISGYVSILIGGTLFIFGKQLIFYWVGEKYLYANTILIVLLIPSIFESTQSPSMDLLFGISKHKFLTYLNTVQCLCNILVSVVLVKYFGLIGVAYGTAIAMVIAKIVILPFYVCNVAHIGYSDYFRKVMLPTLAVGLGFVMLYFSLFYHIKFGSFLQLMGIISFESVIAVSIVFLTGFNKREKGYFRSIFA